MRLSQLLLTLTLLSLTTCSVPLDKRHLLVLGDSNGERQGWVYQFQELRGGGPLVNTSISGNTIGYSYGADTRLNSLENLTNYLRLGYAEMGQIDEILIGLGTNDCKTRFAKNEPDAAANLDTLLNRTARFFADRGQDMPRIVLLTPPPIATDNELIDEFQGARACVTALSERIRGIGAERGYCVVDLQAEPGVAVLEQSADGIHFNERGYRMLGRAVLEQCY